MRRLAACLCILAGQSSAEIVCTLTDATCTTDCARTHVQFSIDASQFVAPQSPDDPPRRQITHVVLDDARFVAQAIMMDGGIRGFHEDAGELGSRLMIVHADGSARLNLQPQNRQLVGECEDK